jgi:hypothetical protein
MRRITLALALAGAVIATGCSGGESSTTGGNPGVTENDFRITVQNGQDDNDSLLMVHGYVTSSPAGIDCGFGRSGACTAVFPAGTSVTLTATAVGNWDANPDPDVEDPRPYIFLGWSGDCTVDPCTLTGPADRYIVASFGEQIVRHGNWSAGSTHGPLFLDTLADLAGGQTPEYNCFSCHGSGLRGIGIAVSCQNCHSTGVAGVGMHEAAEGHGSAGCGRCHTGAGFLDYIGADGTADDHLNGYAASGTAKAGVVQGPAYGRPVDVDPTTQPVIAGTYYSFGDDGVLGGGDDSWNFDDGVKCDTCHTFTATTVSLRPVTQIQFPQATGTGITVTTDGVTGICGQCHSGARDGYNVAQLAIAIGAQAIDAQMASNNAVVRQHYLPAAATLLGADASLWYEYGTATNNFIYTARNEHGGKGACSDCHNSHTGELRDIAQNCGSCHFDENGIPVRNFFELEEVRQFGFEGDIDGDANAHESIKAEIDGLAQKVLDAMNAYAVAPTVGGARLCYYENRFYYDDGAGGGTANDGVCTPAFCSNPAFTSSSACTAAGATWNVGEVASASQYKKFTPRLLRAGFNYLTYANDSGAWAHNPRYVVEVLFDTIIDLNTATTTLGGTATPFAGKRAFNGHFGGAEDASPYSAMVYHASTNPPMGFTSGACYQCHGGAKGLATFLDNQVTPPWPPPGIPPSAGFTEFQVNAIQCSTCHTNGNDMKITASPITTLNFPGQKPDGQYTAIDAVEFFPNPADRACAACHSGREGTLSIDAYIASIGGEAAGWVGGFKNPHYLGAAGALLGSNARMMYEFPGKAYTANPPHFGSPHGSLHGASCVGCHEPKGTAHTFEITAADMAPETGKCGVCHKPTAHGDFTLSNTEHEFATLRNELEAAIAAYSDAAVDAGVPGANRVCYKDGHPYFTIDSVEPYGFLCQAADSGTPKMDPALIRATGNYKWAKAEPGAWAHNTEYALEILYDSIVALGGVPSIGVPGDATRPAPPEPPAP